MSNQVLDRANVSLEDERPLARPSNEKFQIALKEDREKLQIDSKETGAETKQQATSGPTKSQTTSQPTSQGTSQAASQPSTTPELNIDKTIQVALQWLRFDPNLRGLADQLLSGKHTKIKFEFNANIQEVASEVGETNWQGDAFTFHAEVRSKTGEVKDRVSLVFFDDKLKRDFPSLVISLQHELCHVQRFEAGQFDPLNRRNEEVNAFTQSIQGLEAVVKGVRESASKLENGSGKDSMLKMASDLEARIQKERDQLNNWKK